MPRWTHIWLRSPLSISGLAIILFFILVAVLAPALAPPMLAEDPFRIPRSGYAAVPQPPSPGHLFGTTEGQYDIFYGVVWGARSAFFVGIVVTGLTVVFGIIVGAVSAFIGGWVDEITQRIVEIVFAFPFLLAALTLATVLLPKLQNGLVVGMVALIAFGWPTYARIMRGDVLAIKERDYILAARATGVPTWRILLRHILPNSITSVLVVAWLDLGTNVLAFASLSFLGLGAGAGYADWGQLISLARNWIPNLTAYWYTLVFPGGALMLFVLGWNLIGDALRDALDPRNRVQRVA
ncbi:MAG TPA: ABC transporter permease [Chloroflexia bacterium]